MGTDNHRSLVGTLLTWFCTAVLVIVVIKMVFWMLGIALGLSTLVLVVALRLLPVLLIGWLAIKLVRHLFGGRSDGESDAI